MRNLHVDSILTGTAMTADIKGTPIHVENMDTGSIHLVWTGTAVGDFEVQISNDKLPAGVDKNAVAYDDLTWITIDTQAAGGGAGSKHFALADLGAKWVTLLFDFGSSSGTVTVDTAFFKGSQ